MGTAVAEGEVELSVVLEGVDSFVVVKLLEAAIAIAGNSV